MAAKLKKVGTDKTREEALVNLRSTLEWLGEDVHTIENEVDPIVEMCTITKAFDNSKVLLANNIKGFPGVRMISNLYSTKERVCRLHGLEEFRDLKFNVLSAMENPIAPNIVAEKDAPVQQVFIPRAEFDNPYNIMPIAQHTFIDGGRLFGAAAAQPCAGWNLRPNWIVAQSVA